MTPKSRFLLLTCAFFAAMLIISCSPASKKPVKMDDAEVLHQNEDQLTQVIIYDVFTPPVASRIYGYASLASYEAMRYSDPKYTSIIAQLKGFGKTPEPEKGKKYNFTLAASRA